MRPEVNNSSNEVCSQHVEIKIAGRLQQFFSAWEAITSDKYILQAVKGYKIEFMDNVGPRQTYLLREISFNAQECGIVDQEIIKLLSKGVVIESQHEKVAVYLQSITTSLLEANPFLKECLHFG